MPAYDPYKDADVGAAVQHNYDFLNKLWADDRVWGERGQERTLREHLFSGLSDEAALRALLKTTFKFNLEPPAGHQGQVRIMLVDIQNARMKTYDPPVNPANELFYVLVLPPKPSRETADPGKRDYKQMQAWAAAWYHATNDGYGM